MNTCQTRGFKLQSVRLVYLFFCAGKDRTVEDIHIYIYTHKIINSQFSGQTFMVQFISSIKQESQIPQIQNKQIMQYCAIFRPYQFVYHCQYFCVQAFIKMERNLSSFNSGQLPKILCSLGIVSALSCTVLCPFVNIVWVAKVLPVGFRIGIWLSIIGFFYHI